MLHLLQMTWHHRIGARVSASDSWDILELYGLTSR